MRTQDIRDQRTVKYAWIDQRLIMRDAKAVSPLGIAVYGVLACHVNNRTQEAFPGVNTIAEILGVSPTTVRERLKALEKARWIDIERHYDPVTKKHEANSYILLDAPPTTVAVVLPQRRKTTTATGDELESVVVESVVVQSSKDSKRKRVQKSSQEQKPPSVWEILVGRESFGITNPAMIANGMKKRIGMAIGAFARTFKDMYGEEAAVSVADIEEFYKWYDADMEGASRPRDAAVINSNFAKFLQDRVDKPKTKYAVSAAQEKRRQQYEES